MRQFSDTRPNDGWLFRGGGMVHGTGKSNYAKIGEDSLPLLEHPELLLHQPLGRIPKLGEVRSRELHGGRDPAKAAPTSLEMFMEALPALEGKSAADPKASFV